MRYFKKEDFNKCMKFLADKPDTVETQQELYKFIHEQCQMLPELSTITVKDLAVYSKVYLTKLNPETANWCATMSDGSQVIWNRKYQEFFRLDEMDMGRCSYRTYQDLFPEINDILKDTWLRDNWHNWRFQETQKQLVAIWNGKYDQNFKNYWKE